MPKEHQKLITLAELLQIALLTLFKLTEPQLHSAVAKHHTPSPIYKLIILSQLVASVLSHLPLLPLNIPSQLQ
jgi:hypothetical protein